MRGCCRRRREEAAPGGDGFVDHDGVLGDRAGDRLRDRGVIERTGRLDQLLELLRLDVLRTGMVPHFSQDAVNVQVDPAFPDRWQQEPYFSKLRELSLNGIRRTGSPGYATLVVSGPEKFMG